MAKGFFDIEQQEPEKKPEKSALQKSAENRAEMQKAYKKAEKIKANILRQLEAGQEPQLILYEALDAIGLLTNDPGFTEATHSKIAATYKDLAQLSFIQDNNAVAHARLKEQEAAYNKTLRNSLNRQLAGYHRIEQALNNALAAVNAAEQAEQDAQPPLT